METIPEGLAEESSHGSSTATPASNTDYNVDDLISEASSSVFIPLDGIDDASAFGEKEMEDDDDDLEEGDDEESYNDEKSEEETTPEAIAPAESEPPKTMKSDSDVSTESEENEMIEEQVATPPQKDKPLPKSMKSDSAISTESEENEMIEEQLVVLDDDDDGDTSDLGERDDKYDLGGVYDLGAYDGEDDSESDKKYDLGAKTYDLGGGSSSETKTYDLGGGSSSSSGAYDLSAPVKSSSSKKKYDLGAFLNSSGASSSRDIDLGLGKDGHSHSQSTKTPHRSGSTALILHKWITDRDWKSVRNWLSSADGKNKRLIESVNNKNEDGETSLHIACRKKAPFDVVKQIIDIAGVQSVMVVDTYGGSLPLHHACHFNANIDVIKLLVYIGGPQSLNMKDAIGNLPLHWALSKNAKFEVVKLLIDIGGRETVTAVNKIGWNTLHAGTFFSSKYKVIKLLVDCGGLSLMKQNKKGDTPLDILYEKNWVDTDSIRLVQDHLGTDSNMVSWLPEVTVERTLNWIRRQPPSAQEIGFNRPFIQMILNHSFIENQFLSIALLDLFTQIVLVAIISFGINVDHWQGLKDAPFAELLVMKVCITWLGLRCAMEMFTTSIQSWISKLSNWLNMTQVVLVIWSLWILSNDGIGRDHEAGITIATLGITWFRSVFVFGDLFYNVAIFAGQLQFVVKKIFSFIVTSAVVLLGFVHMLYASTSWEERNCVDNGGEESQCLGPSLRDSYYATFSEFLNPAALFADEEYLRNNISHMVLAFFFAFVIQIILFNMLMAQIVCSYSESEAAGRSAFWQKRYHYILMMGSIYKFVIFRKKEKPLTSSTAHEYEDEEEERKIPVKRFAFSSPNFEVFPADYYHFRKWWLKDSAAPNFSTRLKYFLSWASWEEILVPGPSFERVISGGKKDEQNHISRAILYLVFPIIVVMNVICFILGLVSFGYLWPKWMKTIVFSGKVELKSFKEDLLLGRHMDSMKNEIKSIHNAVKAEKFVVNNIEDDMKNVRQDIKILMSICKHNEDSSVYSEDASNYSESSSNAG